MATKSKAQQSVTVWRIHLHPGLKGQRKNRFPFCYQNRIIGTGWQVNGTPGDSKDYLRLVRKKYAKWKNTGWKRSPKRICKEMKIGDLVWTKDRSNNHFYIGKVQGKWKYLSGRNIHRGDKIVSTRRCKLYYAGDASSIRKDIQRSFAGDTLQRIKNPSQRRYSFRRFDQACGQKKPK